MFCNYFLDCLFKVILLAGPFTNSIEFYDAIASSIFLTIIIKLDFAGVGLNVMDNDSKLLIGEQCLNIPLWSLYSLRCISTSSVPSYRVISKNCNTKTLSLYALPKNNILTKMFLASKYLSTISTAADLLSFDSLNLLFFFLLLLLLKIFLSILFLYPVVSISFLFVFKKNKPRCP